MSKYVKIQVPDDFDQENVGEFPVFAPQYTNVLDYGFVGLVDFMGDDSSIVNAARVSYGKGTTKVSSDKGLIRYLMRHLHTTPFEMCNFKFHVKAPIFVFRQWHRHRTFSINEYSARYSVLDGEMYHPELGNLKPQSTTNRQGRSDDSLTDDEYNAVMSAVEHIFEESYQTYLHLLGPNENGDLTPPPDAIRRRIEWCKEAAIVAVTEARRRALDSGNPDPYPTEESVTTLIQDYLKQNGVASLTEDFPGVARELARMVLPVATYSQMYWSGNLHNLFHFLNLRCDPHAQYEIRVFADAILALIEPHVPWAVEAFRDYLLNGARLSGMEVEVLRGLMINHDKDSITRAMSAKGCSNREITEFLNKFMS